MSKGYCSAVMLFTVVALGGCATPARSQDGFRGVQSKNLVFNPEWTGRPYLAVLWDSDWPSARLYTSADERIEFRETIIDHQGHSSGASDNHYSRRLYSVRRRGSHR